MALRPYYDDSYRRRDWTDPLSRELMAPNSWDLTDFGFPAANNMLSNMGNIQNALKVDVVEHDNNFQVLCDLPGCDMNDVDINISNGLLHISAKRQQTHEEKNEFSHRIERSFGQVKRSIPVPERALADTADARFENGVLSIMFDKRPAVEGAGPKKLQIRSGQSERNNKGNNAK
jgi:HSP20 family molecular chaperone IbpA